MHHDSVKKTIFVAFVLCVFCSVLVSVASISLKERQDINKKLDIQKNLLLIAGLIHDKNPTKDQISAAFSNIEQRVINLKTGEVDRSIQIDQFDYKSAQKNTAYTESIERSVDFGNIKVRSKISTVYLVKENGNLKSIVLPVHGKGLWSTLWGFISLSADTKTILGLGFYQHGETPGLGGEVDNPKWKKIWKGKMPYDSEYNSHIRLIKGSVSINDKDADQKVDGLSGATITSKGVEGLVNYWLGQNGYGPFLNKIRNGGVSL